MGKDIHKWTDGRYTLMFDEHTFFVRDNEKDKRMTALNVTEKLNEQQTNISALKEENEQLRQQHQRLYNYFRDYLEDEMSGNAFGEMWDTVKVDEKWNNKR